MTTNVSIDGQSFSITVNRGPLNGGTPGGSVGQLQFGNGAVLGGVANTIATNGNLVFTNLANLQIQGGSPGQTLITDGSGHLTFGPIGNVTGNYGNSNVAAYLPTDPTITAIQTKANVTSNSLANLTTSVTGINNQVQTLAANIGAVSTSLTGITANVTVLQGQVYTNSNAVNWIESYGGNIEANNIITAGTVSAMGNIEAPYFIGNGAFLTGLVVDYSNANVAAYLPTYSGNIGNITSTGFIHGNGAYLTGLPASYGNANVAAYLPSYGGNILTANISASGDIRTLGSGGNITGANVVIANTFQGNIEATTITSTGNITVGNLSTVGNVQASYVLGNGAFLTGLPAQYSNANVANYLPTYSGNISAGNVTAVGNIEGSYLLGNGAFLTGLPAQYSNANVANYLPIFTGNISAGNVTAIGNIQGSYLLGNGAFLTGLPAQYSNANVANYLPTYSGNVGSGNISSTGNIYAANVVTTGAPGNIIGANVISANYFIGDGSQLSNITTTAGTTIINGTSNVAVAASGPVTVTVNGIANVVTITDTAITTGNLVATGNIISGNISTTGRINAASITATGNVTAGNIDIVGLAAFNTVNTLGNTRTGNLSVAGNINTVGNIQGSYILGNGAFLTGLPAQYSNANVAAYLPTDATITTINSNVANTNSNVANTNANVTTVSNNLANTNSNVANVVSNVTTHTTQIASLTGNVYANANVAAYLPTYTGNISAGNVTAIGNIQASYLLGNGAFITGLPAGYANANVANYLPIFTGNVQAGNINSSNIVGDAANPVTITANNTSIGDIHLNASNVRIGKQNQTANLTTRGSGNMIISTNEGSATEGRITLVNGANGNLLLQPNGTGNVLVSSTVSVTGNVQAGNISASGEIKSFTANITTALTANSITATSLLGSQASIAGNIVVGQNITATGTVLASVLGTVGTNIANGNITAGNLSINSQANVGSLNVNNSTTISGSNIVGTLTASWLSGNTGITLNHTGTTGSIVGNVLGATVVRILPTGVSVVGNVTANNVAADNVVLTGGIVAPFLSATGSIFSVGNITTNGNLISQGNANVTGNLNISGNIIDSGPLTITTGINGNIILQPNGTGIVTVSSAVSVTGNVTMGNSIVLGTESITGNIQAGNIRTTGAISAQGNIQGSRLSVFGNVTSGDTIFAGTANITNSVTSLRIYATLDVSAAGNVQAGNIISNGLITATGNISSGNITVTGNATVNYTGATAIGQALTLTGSNTQGGSTYFDFIKVTNTSVGATNSHKFIRVGPTGGLEVINSAYSATLMSITDAGDFNVGNKVSINGKQAVNGPAFSAYANSTQQAIPSGTQTKVLFQVEEYDTNSNYSNSRFTPTVEGYYQLNAAVRIDGPSSTGEYMLVIYKNGTEYKRGNNGSGTEVGSSFYSMAVSSLVYANGTSDYYEIYIQQTSGSSKNLTAVNAINITWFNGCMVRGA